MRYDSIEIEGKHGADLVELGYQNFEGTLNDVVIMNDNFDEVLNWLSGTGELIYMGKKTQIHFLDAYQIAKHKRTFSVPFIREPFWYDLEDDYSKPWGANLIPNGWDSFGPYGNKGEETRAPLEVFEEGYTKNMWERDSLGAFWYGIDGVKETTNGYRTLDMIPFTIGEKISFYKEISGHSFRIYYFDKNKNYIKRIPNQSNSFTLENNEEEVAFISVSVERDFQNVSIYYGEHRGFVKAWEDIPEEDKPVRAWDNMAVHMTPLENGLTRIQTWGGNNIVKLIGAIGTGNVGTHTLTTYFDTLNIDYARVFFQGAGIGKNVEKGMFTITGNLTSTINSQYRVLAGSANDNLDFLSGTPTIVEGDKPPTWDADEHPRIVNEGTAPSKPIIKLTKGTSSTCEFEVSGVYFKYHFNNDDHVIIDCEEMEATYNGLPRNRHLTIGFEFPTLKVGDNVVKNISGDAKIEFKRKDRWL